MVLRRNPGVSNNTPKKYMASKAIIVNGPSPMELWMWGMLSSYMFTVKIRGKIETVHAHFQKMIPVPNAEFQIVSFKGYDVITGRRVKCSTYHATSTKGTFGIISVSESKANPSELARKYGPSGSRLRKKPLKLV